MSGVLFLDLAPVEGAALASWDDLDEKVRFALPRVRQGFGVQEVFAHEAFFLRCMLTQMPSPHFPLTVFVRGGSWPLDDATHPVWPLVAQLADKNGWRVYVQQPGKTDRTSEFLVPEGARGAPLPEDHSARVASAVAVVDLSDLASIDWRNLRHAFGAADDVPELLTALASADPHARREAYRSLYGNILHQGSTYPATVAAVPFLLRILKHGPEEGRVDLLGYLRCIGEHAEDVVRAMIDGEADLVRLASSTGELGLEARRVVACLARASATAGAALERYVTEIDAPHERSDLLYFFGSLPRDASRERLLARKLTSDEPSERLAAALALCALKCPTPEALDVLSAVIRDPEPYRAWTADESGWLLYDYAPDEQAQDALDWLDEKKP